MDDRKILLAAGGGAAILLVLAAVTALTPADTAPPVMPATESAAVTPPPLDLAALDEGQRAAFDAAVRRAILDDPGIIMEAIGRLEAQQEAEQAASDADLVAAHAEAIFDDGTSWVGGNPDGDVTVVEFLDYRCGYCRRAHPDVTDLVAADGNIRLVVKEFPILGENSVASSRFALAARLVGGDAAYEAAHEALITLDADATEPVLRRLAETLGLDAEAIFEAMDDEAITEQLQQTRALAQALQINGTPSFVMGDRLVRGFVPLEAMREIVAEERAEG